jgi:hypothetical protein
MARLDALSARRHNSQIDFMTRWLGTVNAVESLNNIIVFTLPDAF